MYVKSQASRWQVISYQRDVCSLAMPRFDISFATRCLSCPIAATSLATRYQESGQDRNMLGAVWESEVFQIQIQRYKHNINMYETNLCESNKN